MSEFGSGGDEHPATGVAQDIHEHSRVRLKPVASWVGALVLLGLLVGAGVLGYVLHGVINSAQERRLAEASAVSSWRAKVVANPDDLPSRLGLADALLEAGDFSAALAEYDGVLSESPRDVAALYGRGSALLKLGRATDAESALWEVLDQDLGHVRAARELGEYYASKKQYRSLVKAVRPAVTLHPTEARLQYLMGMAYEEWGRPDWAAARYQLALDSVPDMPEALEGLRRTAGK
ncbi:MAG: tetratricopeptide repeat protein [Coriobacteriia bacterium]|nr:tetratricopeptide repeat protein [Coriobacteriia bacterium]